MKKIFLFISVFISVCSVAQIDKVLPPKPSSFYAVTDVTKTLTNEQIEALNRKIVQYKDSTSNEIAVVIIKTTDDYSVEELALKILREWGIGSKEKNNGIVILIAKNDRKIRIEVGYGLEGAIPDVTAKSIIDNSMTPNFREENYYRGIDRAIDDIMKAAAGEYKASAKRKKGPGIGAIIFFLVIFFSILGAIGRRGGGGGMISRRGWGGFGAGWIIGSMMSGGSRGGGGWSGGGGFGGFGGGSGGGGGASGGW